MRHRLFILLLISFLIFPLFSAAQTQDPNKVYRVAILPFVVNSQENLDYIRDGIYDILASRVTVEGRIVVIDRPVVEQALYELRPVRLDEATAQSLGMKLGADYVVLGSLTKIGDFISLDARMISVTEDKPPLTAYTQHKGLDDVMVKIGDFAQDIGFKILGRRYTAQRPTGPGGSNIVRESRATRIGADGLGFKKSQTFNFEMKGIDVGDVDGDKKNEVVTADDNNLYIFKYDGDKLKLFRKIETKRGHNILTLDVADLNRDGYAEIVVTSMVDDETRSFILEFEQGEFRKIADKSGWFFRVLHHPKEGPILMGQAMMPEGVPGGNIYRMVWKNKSFEKGPKMSVPKEAIVFGLTMGDIKGQGTPDYIFLDFQDRLNIVSPDGKFVYRSRDTYGGSNISYDTLKKRDPALQGRDKDSYPWREYIPGRILVRDMDGDGVNEVIVNKNQGGRFFGRIRTFDSGTVQDLVWNADSLMMNWRTREVKGYICDYQIADVENDGEPELIVALVDPGEVFDLKGKSNILFFKLD